LKNRSRAGVLASDLVVEEAAVAELASGGSALGTAVAAFFVAAGKDPGVLLSPVSLLTGGVGRGARAFDGRWRQPGRGGRRPRGLLAQETTPPGARVALASSVFALAVAVGYETNLSFPTLLKRGIAEADRTGAARRRALLQRIAAVGPVALTEPGFTQPWLRIANAAQGGLLTPSDFSPPSDLDYDASLRTQKRGGTEYFEAPWVSETEGAEEDAAWGEGQAVIAVDAQGGFAALAYRVLPSELTLDELELTAPLGGVAVKRGVPRLTPGKRLPAPAPIALRAEAGVCVEVLAEPKSERVSGRKTARLTLSRDPATRFVVSSRGKK
jgi:hypothetical protein